MNKTTFKLHSQFVHDLNIKTHLKLKRVKYTFVLLLTLFATQLYAQDYYRFGGLGASDSGGTGYKSIYTTSILKASNEATNVTGGIIGAELFSTNTTPGATAVFSIKADGINAVSFDVNDMTIFNYLSPTNGPSTYTTNTKMVFKGASGSVIRTMTLNANKSLSENLTGISIGTFFDNNNALPVTGVSEIEITITPLTDQPDAFTVKGITLSNVVIGAVPSGSTTINFNSSDIPNNGKLGKSVSLAAMNFSINSTQPNDFISYRTTSGAGNSGALYDDNFDIAGVTRWTVKRHGGDEFALTSIYLQDSNVGASTSGTLKAIKNGTQVGATINVDFDGVQILSGNADFQDIDEFWIEAADLNIFIDDMVYNIVTLGLEKELLENSLSLFPNPVNNELTIKANAIEIQQAILYDILGKSIKQINVENEKIDLSLLNKGIYILKLETDKGVLVKKITKQ
jgi:hypothetical protein